MFDFILTDTFIYICTFVLFVVFFIDYRRWSKAYDLEREALKRLGKETNKNHNLKIKKKACNLYLGSYKKGKK